MVTVQICTKVFVVGLTDEGHGIASKWLYISLSLVGNIMTKPAGKDGCGMLK